jgi:filamentous hemagglutinin family protein
LLCGFVLLCQSTAPACAQSVLPKGGTVAAGSATVRNSSGNGLTITQTTSNAIINWNSFSVGQSNSVTINQPNSSSALLNRVTGSTPSSIAGTISANGSVMLVNPNGIAITPTGTVKVGGGFIGSSLDISNADFQAGNLTFRAPGAPASVSNAGTISAASGGSVALLGGHVSNAGTITVPLGTVGLGAAQQATIDPSGDGFLQVTVPPGATSADGRPLIDVAGSIQARGGSVQISAATAQQAVRDAVHIAGSLSATSVSGHSGSITLDGGAGGNVAVSGSLTTAGGTAAPGGTIVATGASVTLAPAASLNASGTTGGRILVGGDRRGGSVASAKLVPAPVRNAQRTIVAPGASILANGTTGAGGNIVVWSDVRTLFQGAISATATGSGSGGTAEVSSHGLLGFDGSVDLSAAGGVGGTLTLDPYNLTVTTSSTTATQAPAGTFTSGSGTSNVLNTDIQNLLNAGTSVVLATGTGSGGNGDITVSATIAKTGGSAASLTLDASGSIIINSAISSTSGAMAVTLDSNLAGNGGFVSVTAPITTNGGNLIIGGGATPSTGPAVGTAAGNGDGNFPNAGVLLSANLSAGGGNITINGTGYALATNNALGVGLNVSDNVSITTTGSGSISIIGTGGGTTYNNDGIAAFESTITSGTGNISLIGIASPTATDSGGTSSIGIAIVQAGGAISTGGSGTITIHGTVSSAGSGGGSVGVVLATNAISAVNGLISITGTNTSTAAASTSNTYPSGVNYPGVSFAGTTVTSTGTGGITINGTGGGTGAGGYNPGVILQTAGSVETTGTGPISITGTGGGGGGSGGSNYGVAWSIANAIEATSTGSITINGTGGNSSGSGSGNHGVYASAALTGNGGAISITGTPSTSSGGGNDGIVLTSVAAGAGTLTLSSTGAVTASGAITTAGGLDLSGTGGAYTLTASGNSTGTLAGNTGSVTYTQAAALAIGTVAGVTGLTTTGALAITASTTGSSNALTLNGTTVSGGGTSTLSGTASSGIGTLISGTDSLSATGGGTLSVSGIGTSGTGLKVSGSVAINSGAVTFSGQGSGSNSSLWLAGGSSITNNSTGLLTFSSPLTNYHDIFNATVTSTAGGDILISDNSSAQQTLGSITGGNLALSGTGSFTLTDSNAVSTLAGSVGSVQFTDTEALTIGTVQGVSGLAATGSLKVSTTGSLSIASGATVSGTSPLLAATGAFVNGQGSNAVSASSGSWQIFSANPTGDTFDSLNSSNAAVWDTTYAGSANSATGNRYIFAFQPTVTFTPQSTSKVYGANATSAVSSSYLVTGVQGAVANAFTADTASSAYSGSPSVTSTGSAATAAVGSYSITATVGTLSAKDNYALAYGSAATLTVTTAPLTVTANALSRVYGASNPTLTYSTSGLFNGDTVSGTLATAATTTSNVGAYAITQGTLTASSNYALTYVGANLTVTQAPLTVTANAASRIYGASNPTFTYSTSGLLNGDALSGALATAAVATSGVGTYALTQGTLANANYALTFAGANLTVTQAPLTVTANSLSRAYGASNPTLTYTSSGLANGDTLSGALATAATTTSGVGTYAITQGTLAASAN